MAPLSLEEIKKKYNLKSVSVAKWRDPKDSAFLGQGVSNSSSVPAAAAAAAYVPPAYKVRYKIPEPTGDEESEPEDDTVNTDEVDVSAAQVPVDSPMVPSEELSPVARLLPDTVAIASESAAEPIVVDQALGLSDLLPKDSPNADDPEATDEAQTTSAEHTLLNALPDDGTDDELPTSDLPSDAEIVIPPFQRPPGAFPEQQESGVAVLVETSTATTAETDMVLEDFLAEGGDPQRLLEDRSVHFAPGTPDPKPSSRKKKSAKGTKSTKGRSKKRSSIPIEELPDDIVEIVDEAVQALPPEAPMAPETDTALTADDLHPVEEDLVKADAQAEISEGEPSKPLDALIYLGDIVDVTPAPDAQSVLVVPDLLVAEMGLHSFAEGVNINPGPTKAEDADGLTAAKPKKKKKSSKLADMDEEKPRKKSSKSKSKEAASSVTGLGIDMVLPPPPLLGSDEFLEDMPPMPSPPVLNLPLDDMPTPTLADLADEVDLVVLDTELEESSAGAPIDALTEPSVSSAAADADLIAPAIDQAAADDVKDTFLPASDIGDEGNASEKAVNFGDPYVDAKSDEAVAENSMAANGAGESAVEAEESPADTEESGASEKVSVTASLNDADPDGSGATKDASPQLDDNIAAPDEEDMGVNDTASAENEPMQGSSEIETEMHKQNEPSDEQKDQVQEGTVAATDDTMPEPLDTQAAHVDNVPPVASGIAADDVVVAEAADAIRSSSEADLDAEVLKAAEAEESEPAVPAGEAEHLTGEDEIPSGVESAPLEAPEPTADDVTTGNGAEPVKPNAPLGTEETGEGDATNEYTAEPSPAAPLGAPAIAAQSDELAVEAETEQRKTEQRKEVPPEAVIDTSAADAPPSPTLSRGSANKQHGSHWERKPSSKPATSGTRTSKTSSSGRNKEHAREEPKSRQRPHKARRYSTTAEEEAERKRRREARKAEEIARIEEEERRKAEEKELRLIRHEARRAARKAAAEEAARIVREEAEAVAREEAEARRKRQEVRERGTDRPAKPRRQSFTAAPLFFSTGSTQQSRSSREHTSSRSSRHHGERQSERARRAASPEVSKSIPEVQDEVPHSDPAATEDTTATTEQDLPATAEEPPASSTSGARSHRKHRDGYETDRHAADRPRSSRRLSEHRSSRPALDQRPTSFISAFFRGF
ncbi:hypothetical protein BAUCODRAFT_151757 [Baudoinia panamericana UAMH 10762]|uniref:Uncharacterized protein n=1 Tax=Baudoinia panamericana (strain UAMH 10762) TaxID=717646 RepID=M2LEC9_BAUPA|nr:uncharacterized protein BAUCODRAFT_151757 [Baudoinia panamericana UAMH 10762]EMC92352.1 hypothetical protein BAUCODRAFT_151757 [Baudoinia panamericana UAMH 10762]